MAIRDAIPPHIYHRVIIPEVSAVSLIVTMAREWLDGDEVPGIYNFTNHFEEGRRIGIAFWFSDADAAFAFKMRWG